MDDDRKRPPRKNGPKPSGKPFASRGGKGEGAGKNGAAKGPKRDFGGKPRPQGKRPAANAEGKNFGERSERPRRDFSDRPKRDFADKPKRDFTDKPKRDFAERPKRDFADRPKRDFADRTKRDFSDRPKRDFGGKPQFSNRKPRPAAAAGEEGSARREWPKRDFAGRDRPGRAEGDRAPRGDKPFRKGPRPDFKPRETGEGGERPARFDRPRRFEGGDKPREARSFRERPDGERPRGADADRPRRTGEKTERKPVRREASEEAAAGERIAKRLARAGIASRRDAEELIAAGRVKVNGRVLASPAVNVMTDDTIEVDGTTIPPIERTRLFLFHKPAGVVTTNRDPEGRKTVFDVLPGDLPRLMTIGRLDINTEGLLLLTNDGGLSRVLELPATGWLRRYRVRVHGKVDEKALPALKDGIAVDGVFYGSVEATLDREQGTNAWMTIGLREGKNREVKNILGALGLEVSRLIRISYGPFQLGELPEGHVLEIKGRMLRDQLGERLIEEAGANFDAPIVNQFSNQPVRRERDEARDAAPRPKSTRDGERGRIGEGGLIKKRKRREDSRDEALGKLSTKPERASFGDRGDKPRPGKRERPPLEPPGQRRSNVWMASGARPQGQARLERERTEVDARKSAKPGRKGPYSSGLNRDAPQGSSSRDHGGDKRPPSGKGPGRGPRRG